MMRRLLGMLCLLGALAGCAAPADPDQAELAVPEFHLALLEGDFAGIWQRAAPALREAQTQAEFVAYLQQVRNKLGEVRSADRTATRVDGREVTLTYRTVYAAAPASEEFVIRLEEGQAPQLLRYRLLTPALP